MTSSGHDEFRGHVGETCSPDSRRMNPEHPHHRGEAFRLDRVQQSTFALIVHNQDAASVYRLGPRVMQKQRSRGD